LYNNLRILLKGKPGYSEISFEADNGKTYHGMLYQAADVKAPLLIHFGGNGECSYIDMRNREVNNQWKYFEGYHQLSVDYEGYGLNEGSTHYLNMYEQALAVYDYAVTLPNADAGHIVAMGYSLGTGSAVYMSANRPVAGLILAAPYANGYDLYNNVIPAFYGPAKALVRQKLPSDRYAPDVTCPVLVIAGRKDEVVPFSSSERLSALFSGDTELMALEHASHGSIFQTTGVMDKIKAFLERPPTYN